MRFHAPLLIVMIVALGACGVRGRPQPPLEPAYIGRGQPSFQRATEDFAFPEVPDPDATPNPHGTNVDEREAE